MQLAEWMDTQCLTDQAFADRIGVARSVISKVRNGLHFPSLPVADAIIKGTGGEVTADDLFRAAIQHRERAA